MTSGNVPGRTAQTYEKKYETVRELFEGMKGTMSLVLPDSITPERMARIALTECRLNPVLLNCTPNSLIAAVMQASQLGLEPGNALGHCYLVPYNLKDGRVECRMMIGYRGMIYLARESRQISSIYAELVRENELFHSEKGTTPFIKHEQLLKDAGPVVGVYAVAVLRDGGPPQFDVLSLEDIEAAKDRSQTTSKKTPWTTDWGEMAKKTAVRRLFKYLPVSNKAQTAAANEELVELGKLSAEDATLPFVVPPKILDKPPTDAEIGIVEKPGVEEEPPDDGDHSDAAAVARFGPEKP